MINCTYNIEIFSYDKSNLEEKSKILNCVNQNNLFINQGRGWGYEARPDKEPSSILVFWGTQSITENADISLKNNRYYNFRNMYYTYNRNPIVPSKYKNVLESTDNKVYMAQDSSLVCGNGNYNNRDILEEYGQDQNSTFRQLSDKETQQISNPEILNSNDYNEIKTYYENLEKQFAYTDQIKEIVNEYENMQTQNNIILNQISSINNKVENIKIKLQEENSKDYLKTLITQHYQIGTEIIDAYINGQLDIEKDKLDNILKYAENIGKSYDKLAKEITTEELVDVEKIKNTIKETEDIINRNEDLSMNYAIYWINLSKTYLEEIEQENAVENKGVIYSKNLHSIYLSSWAKEFTDIYIDEYIKDNPIKYTYSEKNITNKDVTVTLNIGDDTRITNNNNSNKYTFTQNGEFTFKYERRGKAFVQTVEVTNIDKDVPIIDGVENNKTYEGIAVTPNIQDENLQSINLIKNGVIVDNYTNNTELTEEGIYQLEAIDAAGNKTTVNFKIKEKIIILLKKIQ